MSSNHDYKRGQRAAAFNTEALIKQGGILTSQLSVITQETDGYQEGFADYMEGMAELFQVITEIIRDEW